MKKFLLLIPCFLFCLQCHGQSFTFNQLLHLLKEKEVAKYVTSPTFQFLRDERPFPIDRYIKNGNSPDEEILDYDSKKPSVGYSTRNLSFMYSLVKQIKFRQILKDDDPNGSLYYQFGDTHMTVMINIYKKRSVASLALYIK
jgi:hypothetical protein